MDIINHVPIQVNYLEINKGPQCNSPQFILPSHEEYNSARHKKFHPKFYVKRRMYAVKRLIGVGRTATLHSVARSFCSVPLKLSESQFETAAVKELSDIANILDNRADDIGIDSVDLQEGVLVVEFPNGTFIINKHQASRQIWYSSPVSPPAYFDPVLNNNKEEWWSPRLRQDLRAKLYVDIRKLSGHSVG